MPAHRARATRWPRLRTAAIALTVGATAVAIPILPASAGGSPTASAPVEPSDDTGEPIEPSGSPSSGGSDPDDDVTASSSDESAAADDVDQDDVDQESDEPEGDQSEEADPSASSDGAEPAEAAGAEEPVRVEGGDRVGTSVAVAQDRFPDGAAAAVLASAEDFADALAGAAMADHVDGPLLLTGEDRLDPRVADALDDRLEPGGTVWLLGGPDALSAGVESAVVDLGFATERLEGADRYGTAAAIVREVLGDEVRACDLVLATGTDFADGASASGFASSERPLLFTRGEKLPAPTAEALARCAEEGEGGTVTAVGGAAATALDRGGRLPAEVEVTEVVGEDRYETSARLFTLVRGSRAAATATTGGGVTLASGLDYPDALIGGTYGDPVLLTEPDELPTSVVEALAAAGPAAGELLVIGGTDSVSDEAALSAVSSASDAPSADPEASAGSEVGVRSGDDDSTDSGAADEGRDTATPADRPSSSSSARSSAPAASSSSPTSSAAPRTSAPTPTRAAGGSQGRGTGDWAAAWASDDAEVVRRWFEANVPGPSVPVRGTAEGGKIRSQADADRLAGKRVTSAVSVSCSCTLRDFVLEDAPLTVDSGAVTIADALIDGQGNTDLVGVLTVRGSGDLTLERVQIKGHQDGIRAYGKAVRGEHVYIHSVSEENPEKHHQDGIQVMKGTADFQRSFVDMTGALTSATLIKPDAGPITSIKINQTVMMGGQYTFHVHDGPKGTPRGVDFSGNLVAKGYGSGLMSTWKLSDPGAVTTTATVSGTGRTVTLKDAAKL